jgi:CheY-like chemotaxis protein
MSLVETQCPRCKKKIFLDLEEIVAESGSRPITCAQCGHRFIFGFDADAQPISGEGETPPSPANENTQKTPKKKTKLVKKVVVKKVKKQKPKANKRILVIEDSKLTRTQIKDIFSEIVTDVITAEDAEVGIKLIREGKPDLVIVDLHLPKMSGVDFINSVRKHIPPERIIIFTAVQDMYLDIFDQDMAGVNLIQKTGPESLEALKEKGQTILGIQ